MSDYTIKHLSSRDGVTTVLLQSAGDRGGQQPIDVATGTSPADAARALATKLRHAADLADAWAVEHTS